MQEPPTTSRPRSWVLGLWSLTGGFTLFAVVYGGYAGSHQGSADTYHQQVAAAHSMQWFFWAIVASIVGLLGMLITGGAMTSAGSRRETRWVLVRLGFLLAHLLPWILMVVSLIAHR